MPFNLVMSLEDLEYDTKEELIQKAFEYFGNKFTNDEILDRCNRIWEKYLAKANYQQ